MEISIIEAHSKAQFKKIKNILILLLLYISIALFTVSKFMSIAFFVMALSMSKVLSHEIKPKNKEKPYKGDTLVDIIKIRGFKNQFYLFQLIMPAIAMSLLFFSEILEGPIAYSIMHMSVVMVGIFYCTYLVRTIAQNETLLFDKGLYHQMIYYEFKDIKRHQFIPLKKGGYLFEVNNGKTIASIKITNEIYDKINELVAINMSVDN